MRHWQHYAATGHTNYTCCVKYSSKYKEAIKKSKIAGSCNKRKIKFFEDKVEEETRKAAKVLSKIRLQDSKLFLFLLKIVALILLATDRSNFKFVNKVICTNDAIDNPQCAAQEQRAGKYWWQSRCCKKSLGPRQTNKLYISCVLTKATNVDDFGFSTNKNTQLLLSKLSSRNEFGKTEKHQAKRLDMQCSCWYISWAQKAGAFVFVVAILFSHSMLNWDIKWEAECWWLQFGKLKLKPSRPKFFPRSYHLFTNKNKATAIKFDSTYRVTNSSKHQYIFKTQL